jgi:pimeloyl-ACP methyl ester carboxylesterase
VSQVLIRIAANNIGQALTLSVLNVGDQGQISPSDSIFEDGGLSDIGSDINEKTITVTAVNTNSGPMVFAMYHAPLDFVRPGRNDESKAGRQIAIRVEFNGNSDSYQDIPITITRPPVILIHGVWSDWDTWQYFRPLTSGKSASPFNNQLFWIKRINYGATNGKGFQLNAYYTLNRLKDYIKAFKTDHNVAAVQADVVVHSMGGNIARTWVRAPSFRSKFNYFQGYVHKLITIDTPHLGSDFASRLLNINPIFKRLCYGIFSAGGNSPLCQ